MLQVQKIINIFSPYKTAHLYCADPGAYAVLSVLYSLLIENNIVVRFYCDGWAALHSEIAFLPPQQITFDQALKQDILVLGSQLDFDLTYSYLQKSRAISMTTVFVFDHWKNYLEHFTSNLRQPTLLPNYVFFPDQLCKDEFEKRIDGFALTKELFNPVITGHLAIEHKIQNFSKISADLLESLKQKYGLKGQKLILILLDPENKQEAFGFTLEKNLRAMYKKLLNATDETITVVIKPHPRQDLALFNEVMHSAWNTEKVAYQLADNADSLEAMIAISQEVWGITTMGLVLAKRMGKCIKSFQIDRNALGSLQSNSHIEADVFLE